MAQYFVDHATIEEIVEKIQYAYPNENELWVKPEKSAGVDLMPFLIKSLRNLHRDLCAQYLHDVIGRTHCAYCGFGTRNSGDSVGPMSGPREYGVVI